MLFFIWETPLDSYNLTIPDNKASREWQFIKDRICLLELRLRHLNGNDRRRAMATIDYNKRLLDDQQATVNLRACR